MRAAIFGFWLLVGLLAASAPAVAHPVPFSYIDVRITGATLEAVVVVHEFDVGHDLGMRPDQSLIASGTAEGLAARIIATLSPRFLVRVNGQLVPATWSAPEVLPERQSLRFRLTYPPGAVAGVVAMDARMFPYDPEHRTFLNVYERGTLATQEILDVRRTEVEYFTGTRQGIWSVMRKFVPSGVHHILIGPDHLLFLIGLLLTGGSLRRLVLMVTAFTLAHSLTLSLAALNLVTPPAWLIEPAIALSIVYVGIDNLLRRDGRDVRAWIAFVFGFIHGFGFAFVLRDMGLPSRALGWSLLSFNVGVEIGQLAVVVVVASTLYAVRIKSEFAGRVLATVGSLAVIAAGAYWFVARTFFSGGWS